MGREHSLWDHAYKMHQHLTHNRENTFNMFKVMATTVAVVEYTGCVQSEEYYCI